MVQQTAIVEVYASDRRSPHAQKRRAEFGYRTARGPEIVPQGVFNQAGQRFAIPVGTCLGFTNQAIIEVQRCFHTQISICAAARFNLLVDAVDIPKSQANQVARAINVPCKVSRAHDEDAKYR